VYIQTERWQYNQRAQCRIRQGTVQAGYETVLILSEDNKWLEHVKWQFY